jgi:hypothetical protein
VKAWLGGIFMIKEEQLIEWLLTGDISIQYQVHCDLLKSYLKIQDRLQRRI